MNGYTTFWLKRSSIDRIRPQNASSVHTSSTSPGRTRSTGSTPPNVHAYWASAGTKRVIVESATVGTSATGGRIVAGPIAAECRLYRRLDGHGRDSRRALMALQAAAVAFLGASSLILGALIALTGRLTGRPLSLLIAFGSGALVSAVAYDLVEEAVNVSATGLWVGAGFAAGALTYFVGDELIDRLPGGQAMESG